MRRFLFSGVVALLAFGLAATGARADIGTAVNPSCVATTGDACDLVIFQVDLTDFSNSQIASDPTGRVFLNRFALAPLNTSWTFDISTASDWQIWTTGDELSPLTWDGTNNGDITVTNSDENSDGIADKNVGIFLASPYEVIGDVFWAQVAFATNDAPNWTDLEYYGDFTVTNEQGVKYPNQESYEGTVTPEPATLLLLGTGLLGIAGVARRRKNLQQDGEEEL